jgi:hypothetical protein
MEHPRRFQVEPPRRVLIVGNRGSGKRLLAKIIGERFGLPLLVIEPETPNSIGTPEADDRRRVIGERAKDANWVMTADDAAAFDLTVPRAEWFVWIDLPISTCLVRVIRQVILFRRARRSGKPNPPQRVPRVRDVLNFPGDVTPRIMSTIDRERRNRTIFILRSKGEVSDFIKRLPSPGNLDDHLRPGRRPTT